MKYGQSKKSQTSSHSNKWQSDNSFAANINGMKNMINIIKQDVGIHDDDHFCVNDMCSSWFH